MKANVETFRVLKIPAYLKSYSTSSDSTEGIHDSSQEKPGKRFQVLRMSDNGKLERNNSRLQLTPIMKPGSKTNDGSQTTIKNNSVLVTTRANTLDSTGIDEALQEKSRPTVPKQYFKITKNLTLNYLGLSPSQKSGPIKPVFLESLSSSSLPQIAMRTPPAIRSSETGALSDRKTFFFANNLPKLPGVEQMMRSSDYFMNGLFQHVEKKQAASEAYSAHVRTMHSTLRDMAADGTDSPPSSFKTGLFGPRQSSRPLLVLDLDETLMRTVSKDDKPVDSSCYHQTKIYTESGSHMTAKVLLRPHLEEFLSSVSAHYDVVVYTASEREYAHAIVRLIDPNRKYIKQIFHREHCVVTKKGYITKDLRIIAGDSLQKVVLVDNSAHCFAIQITNGVPILPFINNLQDDELLSLRDFLLCLKEKSNFAHFLDDYFGLRLYSQHRSADDLLTRLVGSYKKRKIW